MKIPSVYLEGCSTETHAAASGLSLYPRRQIRSTRNIEEDHSKSILPSSTPLRPTECSSLKSSPSRSRNATLTDVYLLDCEEGHLRATKRKATEEGRNLYTHRREDGQRGGRETQPHTAAIHSVEGGTSLSSGMVTQERKSRSHLEARPRGTNVECCDPFPPLTFDNTSARR